MIRIILRPSIYQDPKKKNSSSESSDGFGSRSGKTGQKDFNIINFDKIRNLESTKRLKVVQQTIGEQMEVVNKEDRKQEGLKKLAQSSPDDQTTKEVQQQLIDSSMAIKQANRNIEKLKV